MSLTIGKLNRRIAIDQRVDTRVDGSIVESWVPFVEEAFASIVDLSAREFIAASAAQSLVTTKITLRYLPGVEARMRVRRLLDGQIYALDGPPMEDNEGGLRWLTLMCIRGVNHG